MAKWVGFAYFTIEAISIFPTPGDLVTSFFLNFFAYHYSNFLFNSLFLFVSQ